MSKGKVNKRILILCEGVTEYLYAKSLQMELPRSLQRSISVEIYHQTQNDPKSLLSEAKRRVKTAKKEGNSYDQIWLFFDNDNWPQLAEVFNHLNKEQFQFAYSSLCFEHWVILHFENCGKAFSSGEETIKHLKRYWPEYHKTKSNIYKELRDKLGVAIERAKSICKNSCPGDALHKKNPYFTVQLLINYFDELKKEQ
jgi:hypothetical protein